MKALRIETIDGTHIIKVTAFSEVPQEAADIANAIADTYKAKRDQEEADRNKRGLDSLKGQITQQQTVVDDQKTVVEKLRQNLGGILLITPSNDPNDPISKQLVQFRDAERFLEQQQAVLDALNVRLKQVIEDEKLEESLVRILSRAMVSPE